MVLSHLLFVMSLSPLTIHITHATTTTTNRSISSHILPPLPSFQHNHRLTTPLSLRGGGGGGALQTKQSDDNDNDHGDEKDDEENQRVQTLATEALAERQKLRKYRLDQQHLIELRSTFLSEALAIRGMPIGPTMEDVATPDGKKPPMDTDWDCVLSTYDDPKSCLYSFDAEPNTKVISPIDTTQTISLSALNRLRRTDPSKVEPMWHSQYSILRSWFHDSSPYSLLQHTGFRGYIVSGLLLDTWNGRFLTTLVVTGLVLGLLVTAPVWEYLVGRILTCSTLWMKWRTWGRFVHAALPLKLVIGQMLYKTIAGAVSGLEGLVRDFVVEMECAILEECVPITVGDGVEEEVGGDFGNEYDEEVDDEENSGRFEVNPNWEGMSSEED